jgi:hypothetical protein
MATETISFRPSQEGFAERLERSRATLHEIRGSLDREVVDRWMVTELEVALLRSLEPMTQATSAGAFVRTSMEAIVVATERVQREIERMEAYRAFAAEDDEADAFRLAALKASAGLRND